jgi:hypothetical protein
MYVWYNNLLRHLSAAHDPELSPFDDYKKKGGNPFPFKTTLHVLNSAIIKLSRAQPALRVYRGTKVWLDWATIQFRFFGHCRTYTGSFCVFGPVLSSPAHAA